MSHASNPPGHLQTTSTSASGLPRRRTSFKIPPTHDGSAEEHEGGSLAKHSNASTARPSTPMSPATVKRNSQRPLVTSSQWNQDADLKRRADMLHAERLSPWATFIFAYQCLGVIYGDIATSPLYVYATTFPHGVTDDEVLIGSLSIIIWTFTFLMGFKYVTLILQMDDEGEGGTFSIYTLLCRNIGITPSGTMNMMDHQQLLAIKSVRDVQKKSGWWRSEAGVLVRRWFRRSPRAQIVLMVVVTASVGLVLADGVLTPAISVMSAVAGLRTASDAITQEVVIGVTEGLLILLFLCQSVGTNKVAHVFSPIVTLWLVANAAIGVYNVVTYDAKVFKAFNPYHIYKYFALTGKAGWESLGGIMLCITGTEAMFADMGHFTRKSIQLSAWCWVYPCLMMTYIGQCAWLTQHKDDVADTYYHSVPHSLFYPMLILATLTSIVASQALITGSYSIMRQSMRLSLCPKLRVHHTSKSSEGQIYIAEVNYILMVLCIIVVAAFQDTAKLGNAYGVAVMAVMIITTCLACLVELIVWEVHPILVACFFALFFSVEMVYWSANLLKVPQGGWFPLVMASVLASIMFTWWAGERRKKIYSSKYKARLEDTFTVSTVDKSNPVLYLTAQPQKPLARPSGMGIYYSDTTSGTPTLMQHFLFNVHSLQEVVVLMTVRFLPMPLISQDERLLVRVVPNLPNFYQVVVRYGYQETVNHGSDFVSFMVGRITQFLELSAQDPNGDVVRNGSLRSARQSRDGHSSHEVELSAQRGGGTAQADDFATQNLLTNSAQLASATPQLATIDDGSEYGGDDSRKNSVCSDYSASSDAGGSNAASADALRDHAHGGVATVSAPATGKPYVHWPLPRPGLETRSARHSGPSAAAIVAASASNGGAGGSRLKMSSSLPLQPAPAAPPTLFESLSSFVRRRATPEGARDGGKGATGGGGLMVSPPSPSAARMLLTDDVVPRTESVFEGYSRRSLEQGQFMNPALPHLALGEVVIATGGGPPDLTSSHDGHSARLSGGDTNVASADGAGGSSLKAPAQLMTLSQQPDGSGGGGGELDTLSGRSHPHSFVSHTETPEARALLEAYDSGVVYFVGKNSLHVPEGGSGIKKAFYNQLYGALDRNSWADRQSWEIPTEKMVALDIVFKIE